jgi:two-component system sensor histidine kinase KdpD
MKKVHLSKPSSRLQYKTSLLLVLLIGSIAFVIRSIIGYEVVALVLLVVVSLMAMTFEILPVLMAAVLSALILNFFFIPPYFTFHIDNSEDLLLFLIYLIVALLNAVLTYRIRRVEKIARDKEEKENSLKLYNTLFNSLSHELRTPIATILGAVDTLKENKSRLSTENQMELLSEIDIASIRLNRQVENLLNMSRLETGTLKLKQDWCDVNELLFSVIQKLQQVPQSRKIEFPENEDLPLFKLDSGIMEQVIHNIIYNAIQYTPENSLISISAQYIDEKLTIIISDNGNGFSEDEIPFLFNKFYRSPDSKAGGTGLGLSIVKAYIEAHHGTITAENNLPQGAKFTIQLPAACSFINNLKNE